MKLNRRTLLKAGAAAAATTAAPLAVAAGKAPVLLVFDSRIPASLLSRSNSLAPAIDVAREDALLWRGLRNAALTGTIIGHTRWSDFVVVRGLLEEQGKRLVSQTRKGNLFQWEMA
jgi:hypothetical protein